MLIVPFSPPVLPYHGCHMQLEEKQCFLSSHEHPSHHGEMVRQCFHCQVVPGSDLPGNRKYVTIHEKRDHWEFFKKIELLIWIDSPIIICAESNGASFI